jgi:hypothetical protein
MTEDILKETEMLSNMMVNDISQIAKDYGFLVKN